VSKRGCRIWSLKLTFAAALLPLVGCQTSLPASGTAIEALCDEWRQSLPTSHSTDTTQTRLEVEQAYNVWKRVCDE
jgi:hypothetical protein